MGSRLRDLCSGCDGGDSGEVWTLIMKGQLFVTDLLLWAHQGTGFHFLLRVCDTEPGPEGCVME